MFKVYQIFCACWL